MHFSAWCTKCIYGVIFICRYCIYGVVFICRYCIYGVAFICRYCIYSVLFICRYCIYKYPLPILISYCDRGKQSQLLLRPTKVWLGLQVRTEVLQKLFTKTFPSVLLHGTVYLYTVYKVPAENWFCLFAT